MDKLIKGQLVKVWYFGVVLEVFDDMYYIITENKLRLMKHNKEKMNKNEIEDTLSDDVYIRPLLKNGEIVMAKRTLFGKYLFESKF